MNIANSVAVDLSGVRLRSLVEEALLRARRQRRSILVSTVRAVAPPDPLLWFEQAGAMHYNRLFWSRPSAGFTLVGAGAAWTLTTTGPRRFVDAAAAWRERRMDAVVDMGDGPAETGPLLMGGFAFDPRLPGTALWHGYPDGLLLLPRYMLTRVHNSAWITANVVVQPDDDPEKLCAVLRCTEPPFVDDATLPASVQQEAILDVEDTLARGWKAGVRTLVQEIRRGEVQKVVLARQLHLRGKTPFAAAVVLRRLGIEYPDCFVYAIARGDKCFLGASPERLAHLRDGALAVSCLAGSAARGGTAEQDLALEASLLASAKERSEHQIVVRALRDALAELPVDLEPIPPSSVMKMANVQHLFTPLAGRVANGCTIFDLIARLHPSPAVGGYPRDAALQAIREHEALDRGWYAGPVGWVDARGEGEFAVAIRSALVQGNQATLFAGCGIVAGSDPEREYAESCLKLRAVRSALGGSPR